MRLFKDWFGLGPLGPYVATPRNRYGWLTSLGLALPALTYALVGGGAGRILAGGLFAFVFGFSYAIAEETRSVDVQPVAAEYGPGPEIGLRPDSEETPLAA